MDKDLQDLQVLQNNKPETPEESPIEPEDTPLIKPKKPRTPAQMEAFNKAKEKAKINAEERKKQREIEEAKRKAEEEALIVKKAIAIKKKEVKRKAVLEQVPDDDTPLEQIKQITKANTKPVEPPKPKTIFERYKFI
jgi:hypothetical protein